MTTTALQWKKIFSTADAQQKTLTSHIQFNITKSAYLQKIVYLCKVFQK